MGDLESFAKDFAQASENEVVELDKDVRLTQRRNPKRIEQIGFGALGIANDKCRNRWIERGIQLFDGAYAANFHLTIDIIQVRQFSDQQVRRLVHLIRQNLHISHARRESDAVVTFRRTDIHDSLKRERDGLFDCFMKFALIYPQQFGRQHAAGRFLEILHPAKGTGSHRRIRLPGNQMRCVRLEFQRLWHGRPNHFVSDSPQQAFPQLSPLDVNHNCPRTHAHACDRFVTALPKRALTIVTESRCARLMSRTT